MDAGSGGQPSAERRLEVGRICDGYVVEGLLAESDGAAVYRVQDVKHRTQHALKMLRRLDSRRTLRIEQEAIFREELAHPNIAPAFESIVIDGQLGLVMDLVEGPSLAKWMADEAPDDLGPRLVLFRGIVEGCRHAHSRGVVHRDLKPSNVLLQRDRSGAWFPRISDFGVARALAPEVGRYGGLTTVNTGLGTAGYAAPEQVRDATSVDERADLYSLGCILYELVCGMAPFAGLSMFDTLAAQRDGRYRPPRDLAPGLPPSLYALITALMEPDRERRLASCDLLLVRLDEVISEDAPQPARLNAPAERDSLALGPALLLTAIPAGALLTGAAVVFLLG
jgi:eukaryotic-like serine/threonine-protein kinase